MKEALPLNAATDESDDPREDAPEDMKGGMPATATGGPDGRPTADRGDEPKA